MRGDIKLMICICHPGDIQRIYFIINEAAKAYEGIIPADCYHQPYMTMEELQREMKRMTFFGWEAKPRASRGNGF